MNAVRDTLADWRDSLFDFLRRQPPVTAIDTPILATEMGFNVSHYALLEMKSLN